MHCGKKALVTRHIGTFSGYNRMCPLGSHVPLTCLVYFNSFCKVVMYCWPAYINSTTMVVTFSWLANVKAATTVCSHVPLTCLVSHSSFWKVVTFPWLAKVKVVTRQSRSPDLPSFLLCFASFSLCCLTWQLYNACHQICIRVVAQQLMPGTWTEETGLDIEVIIAEITSTSGKCV